MSLKELLKNKKILVTGAGRGIGRALCVRLHEYGASVYALSQNVNNLASLKNECPGITTICADLSNWEVTRAEVAKLEVLDGLINNAGVSEMEIFLDISPQAIDKVFSVNIKAVVNVSQVVAQKMIEAGKEGSIVNISSVAAKRGMPGTAVYCASKAALDMITQNMAVELGPQKIRVNSVNPGPVDTDMMRDGFAKVDPALSKTFLARMPLGNLVTPMHELVNLTLFVLSGMAKSITGNSIVIDNGYLTT